MNGEDPLTLARWLEQGFGVLSHLGCGLLLGLWLMDCKAAHVVRGQASAAQLQRELKSIRRWRSLLMRCLVVAVLIRVFVGADEEVRWFMFWFR
jgi:hypothetical protein